MAITHPAGPDPSAATVASDAPAESRAEADPLVTQPSARARDVSSAQRRLAGLVRANRMIIGDLELPVVLRSIIEAACGLLDAPYGALGVLAPGGGLEQFIDVGIDEATVVRMGDLPEGKGLLGAIPDDRTLIRLANVGQDSRWIGFQADHPAMTSFLGIPIRVRGEVFGNIYLSGHDDTTITTEDEELIASLAATAGVAIENARLFEESHRRQDWLQASTEITRQLLARDGEDPLQVIARRLQQTAGADAVNVVLPTADGRRLMVEVATGAGADQLRALSYPVENTVSRDVLDTGRPVLITNMADEHGRTVHLSEFVSVGPLMVLPLVGMQRTRGALVVGRLRGRPLFTEADLEMATTFASHAALALELSDARSDRERVALLEDRDRIARDLHDHVIQSLFGAGLTVESVAAGLGDDDRTRRLSQVVDIIDETIRQIRTSIFRLRGPLAPGGVPVQDSVLRVAAEVAPALGFQPRVDFAGPLGSAVTDEVLRDLAAVVREGLTNVARHAGAGAVSVDLRYSGGELVLEIADNGRGMGDSERRSGLANLRERADGYGGTLVVSDRPAHTGRLSGDVEGGTILRWTIPLN